MRAERGAGNAGGRAGVLELSAVDVAIQRVAIVGERGEDQVDPRVAVVVARVGAHSRLGAGIAVDRDAGNLCNVLESAVAEVVVEEVRIGVVRHEQIDEPVVVIVGGQDGESVRARRIGEAVRVGRFLELSVAEVFEEEVGLAGESGGADHDGRSVAPDERATRALHGIPGRLDVAGDVQVEVAVAVCVEERATGAPSAGRDSRPGGDVLESAVAAVAEQDVRPPVRHVEIEKAVAVEVPGARAVPPGREVDARLLRHVLELPSAEIPVESVAVRDTLAGRRQLRGGHEVDVEQPVAVVIEQCDAAARGLQDVVFRRTAAIRAGRQLCALLECDGHGRTVVG